MRRKVLHVIDSLDLGGAQTLLLDICKHTDRGRFDVEVACMHGRGVFAEEFEKAGIRVHSLSPGKWPPLYVPNFLKLLKKLDPVILHFHLFGSNLIAKPLAALAGKKALIVHDHCNDAGRAHPMLLFVDALANRVASRVIAVAESVRAFLISHEGMDSDRVVTLANGIDAEAFQPATDAQKSAARKALSLSEGAFVIGGVGRLVPQKNFARFIVVAAQVLAGHPSALFAIAGTGLQESELKEKAVRLGLGDSIRFLGHVSDRKALYHALDALLLTSDFEGTPMTLLEAMSSGLPVVASAVDGIAEVCQNDRDALLVPPRDAGGFVTALRRLISENGLSGRLGRQARATILERYEIRGLTAQIEKIYGEVLGEF